MERWAGAVPWFETHTKYHQNHVGPGVLLNTPAQAAMMALAKTDVEPPAAPPPSLDAPKPHPTNEQAAGVGVSTYTKFAKPYGTTDRSKPSNLKFYPMEGTDDKVNGLLKHHGYQVYYAGGKHGKADLANKNYDSHHLMVWDPSAESGASFGHQNYTDNWRKTHELAHALTYPKINELYGEGRRMGGLGKPRTLNEAKRAVHWEHLVAHKQRELAAGMGIHISDQDFNKEYNTIMHDAVHRAVTGKFTEPSEEGFEPHPHAIPLEQSLGMIDQAAAEKGLTKSVKADDVHELLLNALYLVLRKNT